MIINGALQPFFQKELVEGMRENPFSLSVDGSNDTGIEKMNPLTVKIFDTDRVKHAFLDMCTTSGQHAGTAETLFTKMEQILNQHSIPWEKCVALSVDNAPSNFGAHNSIKSRLLLKNPAVYVLGCPCHILHNNASKASDAYAKVVGFDVEDLCVDVGYWFDKSTNRKGLLKEFCTFCDTEYRGAIKHGSTRWLSLQRAIDRNLMLYAGLKSYFCSAGDSSARFKRLEKAFEDPMTEIHLFFMQNVIPTFTRFNLLLQRGDPSIHILHTQMYQFLKQLLGKFIKATMLTSTMEDVLKNVDYKDHSNQLEDAKLNIGLVTRSKLNEKLRKGDISAHQIKKIHNGVRKFLITALVYARSHLPLNDDVIKNAQFVDVQLRAEADVNQVFYFAERYTFLINIKIS